MCDFTWWLVLIPLFIIGLFFIIVGLNSSSNSDSTPTLDSSVRSRPSDDQIAQIELLRFREQKRMEDQLAQYRALPRYYVIVEFADGVSVASNIIEPNVKYCYARSSEEIAREICECASSGQAFMIDDTYYPATRQVLSATVLKAKDI